MIEETLWSAIRALEERAMLLRHAGEHLPRAEGGPAADFATGAAETQQRADVVRRILLEGEGRKTAQQG